MPCGVNIQMKDLQIVICMICAVASQAIEVVQVFGIDHPTVGAGIFEEPRFHNTIHVESCGVEKLESRPNTFGVD